MAEGRRLTRRLQHYPLMDRAKGHWPTRRLQHYPLMDRAPHAGYSFTP